MMTVGSRLRVAEVRHFSFTPNRTAKTIPHNSFINWVCLVFTAPCIHGSQTTWPLDRNVWSTKGLTPPGYKENLVFLKEVSSVHSPFLFLLYINDLPDVVSNGITIVLFAKCLRVIRTCNDTVLFQQEINHLYDWTDHWGLSFNLGKCESSRFSWKRNSPVPSLEEKPYTLGATPYQWYHPQKTEG